MQGLRGMQQTGLDGTRLIVLLIGVCLGMTLVATIVLWSGWSPLMRVLVLTADALWMAGASRLVLTNDKRRPPGALPDQPKLTGD
jgi:hypothetical protein